LVGSGLGGFKYIIQNIIKKIMISKIKKFVSDGKVQVRHHARIQMRRRKIRIDDVVEAVSSGEVIEKYPEDTPFPSCLIYGKSNNRPIHVVCALSDEEVIIITAYEPCPDKWIDFRFRRKK